MFSYLKGIKVHAKAKKAGNHHHRLVEPEVPSGCKGLSWPPGLLLCVHHRRDSLLSASAPSSPAIDSCPSFPFSWFLLSTSLYLHCFPFDLSLSETTHDWLVHSLSHVRTICWAELSFSSPFRRPPSNRVAILRLSSSGQGRRN